MPLGKLDVAPAVCLLRSRRSDRQDLTVAGWRRLLLSRPSGTLSGRMTGRPLHRHGSHARWLLAG